jgi:cyclopropane fatty-acyl-phospholipid synthase-like methyltransferase
LATTVGVADFMRPPPARVPLRGRTGRILLGLHLTQAAPPAPMPDKPYSAACERNREPILEVLRRHWAERSRVLEIGSGTGQHAVHFARALPHLVWQTSDRAVQLPGIRQWLDEAALPNTPPPIELDVTAGRWPDQTYDAVFSANTLHILSWPEVEMLFAGLDAVLAADAQLVIYGPFNYEGRFTSPSNAEFDRALRAEAAHRGIRDAEAVDALAQAIGLRLVEDQAMPAHNRCRVWQRTAPML